MSEDIIDTAIPIAGLPERNCITQNLPIHGFDFNSNWSDPLHVYGTDIEKIKKIDSYKSKIPSLSGNLKIDASNILPMLKLASDIYDIDLDLNPGVLNQKDLQLKVNTNIEGTNKTLKTCSQISFNFKDNDDAFYHRMIVNAIQRKFHLYRKKYPHLEYGSTSIEIQKNQSI